MKKPGNRRTFNNDYSLIENMTNKDEEGNQLKPYNASTNIRIC